MERNFICSVIKHERVTTTLSKAKAMRRRSAVSRPSAPEIVVGFSDGQLGFASQTQLTLPGGGTAFNLIVMARHKLARS